VKWFDAMGQSLRLTPTEWGLLDMLVRHAGKLVSQRQLLREVWGPAYGEESNRAWATASSPSSCRTAR
jgi:DNA-binding response OmpR family regulator